LLIKFIVILKESELIFKEVTNVVSLMLYTGYLYLAVVTQSTKMTDRQTE